jgi:hypothetical protein
MSTNNKFQFLLNQNLKDPESWKNEDVLLWLKIIKMDQYTDRFHELKVDGWIILEIDEDDLIDDLNISIKLHRKKILKGKSCAVLW